MFTFDKKIFTIPFFLTSFRILTIPFLIVSLLYHQWHVALCLFTLGAISDVLDGAFARLFHEHTALGAIIDPLGDKLLTLSTFGILSFGSATAFYVPHWLFYIILAKELLIMVVAAYLVFTKSPCMIHAGWAGKIAMFIQTIYLFTVLLFLFTDYRIVNVEYFSIVHYIIAASLVVSLGYYAYQLVRCKRTISTLILGALLIPSIMEAKKSDFVIVQPKAAPKKSLSTVRQNSAEQLESIAHNLTYEIETTSALLHKVMHSIRAVAEGNSKKGVVACIKNNPEQWEQKLDDLEQTTRARTVELKATNSWFKETVFSCNLEKLEKLQEKTPSSNVQKNNNVQNKHK